MKKLLLLTLLLSATFAFSQSESLKKAEKYLNKKAEVTFSFVVENVSELKDFSKELSIVNFNENTKTVKAWANKKQFEQFLNHGIPFNVTTTDNEIKGVQMTSSVNSRASNLTFPLTAYPTYADYALQMANFAADNPSICQLVDIGGTGEGVSGGNKRLLFIKLSDNVGVSEKEPKLMYTSSMHGDEIAGFPMMLNLINYFITAYKDVSHVDHARIKNLIDNSEVWINPMANPDGTYYGSSSNTSVANARRANANGLDLNRNYPDNVAGPHDDGEAYQVETLAFMNLAENNHFVLSANFHGGIEVVNYPWDNTSARHPDDDWFMHVSREYATNTQNNSPSGYMDDLNNGITHGADWYLVHGGRQDYMNYYHQTKEVTIELSNIKLPAANQLVNYWNYNKEALIDYLVQGTYGFSGIVKDAVTGNPIEATVKIANHDALGSWTKTTLPHGDYYRPIKAGTYDIVFEAPCYQSFTLSGQTISDYQTLNLPDVMLTPIGATAPSGLSANNIGATSATLSWDTISGATYDLRYRKVGETNWIDVPNLTSAVHNLSGLIALTDYEVQVRSKCDSNDSAYSNSVNFTTTEVQLNYCDSASTNVNDEYIGRVQLNTIDNSSGAQFYTDFTAMSATLTKETQYTITVTPTWTGTTYNEGYSVWIDYNKDGDFTDAGEQVWSKSRTKTAPVSGSFTIPSGAVEGPTRMRVSMKYNAVPTSCETFQYGEVEDYTVIIESLVDTTAPVITLIGSPTIDLNVGDVYTEEGATATDNIDGDISANIIIGGDTVDGNTVGTYVVTYNVSDAAGNASTEVTRTVNVIPDTTAPVITLIGSSTIDLNVGDVYTEQGATATDNIDGDISANIIIGGDTVDGNTVGTYIVTYNVSDVAGNAATQVIRTIIVTEPTSGCVGGISSFPYAEGFENTLGDWVQASNDDINWTVDANGTPSSSTGPSSAAQGNYYIFVEASSPNYPSKRAILNSPCFDLSAMTEATFSFKYHMYGSNDMGTIDLEISSDEGGTWTSIWSESGDKGNSWQTANVDISAYTGGGVQLRFNRVTGGTWQADIAIDDVSLVEGGIVVTSCSGGISSFPYAEGFENTLGAWVQASNDDINWTVDANGTPSSSTGPSSAAQGNYYIFVEASSPNYPSKRAILNSPCFDLSAQSSATFNFSYHMYGSSDMGNIALESSIDNGATWKVIWSESGNKGNTWLTANINLDAYVGGSVQLRFNRVTGGTWQADIAIDNLSLNTTSSARNSTVAKAPKNDGDNYIKLYPNPVNGNHLNVITTLKEVSYEVYNMLGQLVSRGKVIDNRVDVSNLESAVYQIKFIADSKIYAKRFIKE